MRNPTKPLLVALLAMAVPIVAARQAPAAKVTVFVGARLITGDGSSLIEDSAFIVEGTRFGQFGSRGEVKFPAGAERVSLIGKTVMPAIIDSYTHLSGSRPAVLEQLQRKAYYGVAAVMSLGVDAGDAALQLRREVIPDAARLLVAGRGLSAPAPQPSAGLYPVTTESEARRAVEELAAKPVDLVEIWVADRDGRKLAPELYRVAINQAHARNLRVIAHISTLQDAKDLLRAGVDALADGVQDQSVDDELIALFKQHKNVFYVPNLPDQGVAINLGWLADTVPPDDLKKLQAEATDRPQVRAAFRIQHANMIRLHYAGVRIALGSNSDDGWSHLVEMYDMASAARIGALVPMDVLAAATRNSAELLGLSDYGAIRRGNLANFLVLDGNPALDIAEARKVVAVYLRGHELDRAGLRARWGARSQ